MKSRRSRSKKSTTRGKRSRSKSSKSHKSRSKSVQHVPSKEKKKEKPINIFKQTDAKKDKIYLDANATTPMCKEAIKAVEAWVSCGNPSSNSNAGKEAKNVAKGIIEKECPKCKEGKLVLRKSIYGSFYGCSRFPKCRCTEKLKDDSIPT